MQAKLNELYDYVNGFITSAGLSDLITVNKHKTKFGKPCVSIEEEILITPSDITYIIERVTPTGRVEIAKRLTLSDTLKRAMVAWMDVQYESYT